MNPDYERQEAIKAVRNYPRKDYSREEMRQQNNDDGVGFIVIFVFIIFGLMLLPYI